MGFYSWKEIKGKNSKILLLIAGLILGIDSHAAIDNRGFELEEVIVTAQKREQSLQETPIAISVLNGVQLESLGINDLRLIASGIIPSVRVMPFGNTPSNLVFGIRGNAPRDSSEVTREASVGVYLDGVYIARSQGLGIDLIDLERVEVLRGPQGSLFGRNAVGGAISLVSKKPTGELGVKQIFTAGRFDEFRSVTRINLPQVAGISAKLDYLHSEREGWVNNTAPGQADYNEYEKQGGRFSLNGYFSDELMIDYSYDQSKVEAAQNYYQLYIDRIGVFGEERKRRNRTRFPVLPLDLTVSETRGHALTISWNVSESLTFKSISAYRELEEDANNNYAGVLYFNGLNDASVVDQEQVTQEFQLLGSHDRLEWVTGLYYLKEEVDKTLQASFTLDIFNVFDNGLLSPITPPTTFDALGSGSFLPPRIVNADARSQAVYGQATWNPNVLENKLWLTAGARYTEDERSASRFEMQFDQSDLDSENLDTTVVLDYQWQPRLSTYIKWSTAYKAGGVNTRSVSFTSFDEETADTLELGIKSEFWNSRARLNIAVFRADYEDLQLDFSDPVTVGVVETINGENTVEVDGFEIDLTLTPLIGFVIGVGYSYLDGDMPLQPNPIDDGALKEFFVPLAPQHAGSLTLDYSLPPWQIGILSAHLSVTSTDDYSFAPFGEQRTDAYTLLNGRITLSDIGVGNIRGSLKASLWGKNLTDEEYIIDSFPVGDPAVSIGQAFGDPRTLGVDITYQF